MKSMNQSWEYYMKGQDKYRVRQMPMVWKFDFQNIAETKNIMLEASKFYGMISSLHPQVLMQIAQKLPSAKLKLQGMYDFTSCL